LEIFTSRNTLFCTIEILLILLTWVLQLLSAAICTEFVHAVAHLEVIRLGVLHDLAKVYIFDDHLLFCTDLAQFEFIVDFVRVLGVLQVALAIALVQLHWWCILVAAVFAEGRDADDVFVD